jgi:ABC-2 type transport system ATP-binding protein
MATDKAIDTASEVAIRVGNVSKTFRLPHERHTSIKGLLVNFARRQKGFEKQQVLKNVSFDVRKGEFFGIVGRNGSGKSTLLKLLAGIYIPDKGTVDVRGKLTPFIELGVGFNPELTGRENVFLNGALLGFNRREMTAMYDDIVDFAELERFMDQKLKNYSSGMQVRLAFSIATRVQTNILLIDEVLAVGDAIFQQKCFDYFKELKRRKKTVVFVSHDAGALRQFCDRGILIEAGKKVVEGQIGEVVNRYHDILNQHEAAKDEQTAAKKSKTAPKEKRWGSRELEVLSIAISGSDNTSQKIFTDKDETLVVKATYRSNITLKNPNYGITVNDSAGQQVFASSTDWKEMDTGEVRPGMTVEVTWKLPNVFNTGTFEVNPAVSNTNGVTIFDWRDGLGSFKIRKSVASTAFINASHSLDIKPITSTH